VGGGERVGRIVVLGDVITDVVARPAGPLAPGTDTTAAIALRGGGAGGNLAAWLAHLGASVALVARVGADAAAWHRERLPGVDARLVVDAEAPTGAVVALVDPGGERTMLTARGASLGLSPADLPGDLWRPGDLLHVSGYALLAPEPRAAALDALARARAAGMRISVDPASRAYLAEAGAPRFLDWTRGADVAFPALDEGRALTGEEAPERVAAALLDAYAVVVLTLGPAGLLQAARGSAPLRLPAAPAAVVDAIGAGDALAAGWLAAWQRGEPLAARAHAGLAAAAAAVAGVGGRP